MPAHFRTRRLAGPIAQVASVALVALSLGGCVSMRQVRLGAGEEPTLIGPAVRDNRTPMDAALACLAPTIAATRPRPLVIGVGDVRDYTGKYSVNEGNSITQGGALMVYSALGKLRGAVSLAERFDPMIGERELGYTDRRQLGDGQVHDVAGAAGAAHVPWLPYYGGSIAASDYYIVGGITELNYDIRSGGIDAGVSQLGPKARTYTQSVAIDLRIVDTRTLLVVKTISLTKQFTGYEVGFNLFRFFGSDLFDINAGVKGQEPLQLGIRTALEEGTLRLIAGVSKIDPAPCLARQTWAPMPAAAVAAPPSGSPPPAVQKITGAAFNGAPAADARLSEGDVQLPFEFASADLQGPVQTMVDRIAAAAGHGSVGVMIVARDTETLEPAKRDALTDQRIAALLAALAARGVAAGAVTISWRPDRTDTAVHHGSPGLQNLAQLRVGG
ncbi:CsgG/HfaB family protein [Sphingomonas sp. AR_OL41]|uniref:CsgG/HfaB family protein n=1 Tax=Sphingomonas sp. AR_OL41 TaxID=3042729 RepID=UPI002481419C|nr:CsgG/HfaB family protein [Sphingomonas sp. AR_OL41]MDH7972505.1 CsgG/HfaB family protein [Sphingomonas sp. AR_OL41]